MLVNGQSVGVRDKVWGGESVTVFPEADPATQPDEPEEIPLDIVFEDLAILIINKPAGLVVHPGSGNHKGTLLNALLHHTPGAAELPRAGIVHRLDKDTSGLMVVAKTLKAHTDLVRQMQGRTVKREYLALVQGEIDRPGTVDAPLARDPIHRSYPAAGWVLSRFVHDLDAVGVLLARAVGARQLARRDAVAVADSTLYSVGERVVGHEFHRTEVAFSDSYQPAWVYRDGTAVHDGVVQGGVHAAYLHTHPAATPAAIARFVANAAGSPPR